MSTDTKSALLDSAEHAARSRGIDGFSYADLATAVGIRKASIHYHFPSKADLSAALMDRYHQSVEAACVEIDHEHSRGGARLAAVIAFYRAALNDGQTLCLCVSFIMGWESLHPPVHAKIDSFRAMMLDWLTATFTQGLADGSIRAVEDPSAEAHAALAMLEGAQIAARACADPARFDQSVRLLLARCDR